MQGVTIAASVPHVAGKPVFVQEVHAPVAMSYLRNDVAVSVPGMRTKNVPDAMRKVSLLATALGNAESRVRTIFPVGPG